MSPTNSKVISGFFTSLGEVSVFIVQAFKDFVKGKIKIGEIIDQCVFIGVSSLPIVLITACFTGMVMALQTIHQLKKFNAEIYVGGIVALSMARELGPVFTSLIVAGRVGSAIAAQLGTMKVTEQIDALVTLGVSPINYLVKPRLMAFLIMLPALVIISVIVGYFGGYFVGVYVLNLNETLYLNRTTFIVETWDIISGVLKSVVFAGIIALTSCYIGLNTSGGAEGVGKATTRAVVYSSILILISNYFLTAMMSV